MTTRTRKRPDDAADIETGFTEDGASQSEEFVDHPNGIKLRKGELSDLIGEVVKHHGHSTVSSGKGIRGFKHIPTGIFALDYALGGGIPEGLCTMIFGWASGGKTTATFKAIAGAQKKHPTKNAVFVDAEGTFDPEWAETHGVDLDRLILVTPSSGEQAADICIAALKAEDVCIVALDSLPALTPMKEMEKSMEDATVGGSSQLIGRFLRKATQTMNDERKRGHWPTLILINQWRYKIGVVMGDNRTLPGGTALNYVASVKVEMKNKEIGSKTKNTEALIELNEHSFQIHKNKVINGPRHGEFQMIRDPGNPLGVGFIDEGRTIITVARNFGLVSGGGSKWKLDGVEETFGNLHQMVDFLYENETTVQADLRFKLLSMQREKVGKPSEGWY